jgi:uncharacterized membrane protein YcaP (DUF421 family)
LELLREQGGFSPGEVEIALIETDGALSILKKPTNQEMTQGGMSAPTPGGFAKSNMVGKELIIDGEIISENLQAAGMSMEELLKQLECQGIPCVDDVILCLLTPKGELYVDKKRDATGG